MIYLVEDDESIRELVSYALNGSELETIGFARPSEFWHAMEEKIPLLVLLDIMLPEEDGLSILKKLRSSQETKRLPVIMLTAKSAEYDRVAGLDSGADDYIAKPFSMAELIARVRALLRRVDDEPRASEYTIGPLHVSTDGHTVSVNGTEVSLTLKEFELLHMLLENKGRVLSRDKILRQVWDYDFDGENRTIDVHIRTLRQKLGPAGELIETVRGVGYKIRDN